MASYQWWGAGREGGLQLEIEGGTVSSQLQRGGAREREKWEGEGKVVVLQAYH